MKIIFTLFVMLLASCGKVSTDGVPESKREPQCGDVETLCLLPVKWTIESTSVNFPKNYALFLDDQQVFTSCPNMKQPPLVPVENNRVRITYLIHLKPIEALKIEIIDRGPDCKNNALFHSENEVQYSVVTIETEEKKSHNVTANLNN